MRVFIFGSLYGKWFHILRAQKELDYDVAIGCGLSGLYNRWSKKKYKKIYEIERMPKNLREKTVYKNVRGGDFFKFFEKQNRNTLFPFVLEKPTYVLKHFYDQASSVVKLEEKQIEIPNLNIMKNGDVYRMGGVTFGGLGGRYSHYLSEPVYKSNPGHREYKKINYQYKLERKKLKDYGKIDILLMNDIVGGWDRGRALDFSKDNYGTNKLCEDLQVKFLFLGGFFSNTDTLPAWKYSDGSDYIWVLPQDLEKKAYILDTETFNLEIYERDGSKFIPKFLIDIFSRS